MFKIKGQSESCDDNIRVPNIVINPADYPRYVTSALIYSQVIEKTKHVIYKNKCLAHRDQARYPDHVTILEKKGNQRRPWYHVHQCLDEKCPVHPENVRLPNVKEVNVKQDVGDSPSFLCSYLKDKVDIDLYPFYKASIQNFNASYTPRETRKKKSRVLSCIWHDPCCKGCDDKELHVCPVENTLDLGEESGECGVFDTDISDILYKYRFLFNPDYIFGSADTGSDAVINQETKSVDATLSSVGATRIDESTKKAEFNDVNEISTCVGQVPRTPTRHYSNFKHNTPRLTTPKQSPFFNWTQRSRQSYSPSPYYTPRHTTPSQSPFGRTITPYSPTCVPYCTSSPYSTPPRNMYTPPIYMANQQSHFYYLSHPMFNSSNHPSSSLTNYYGYLRSAGVSQESYQYAPEYFAKYHEILNPNYSSHYQPYYNDFYHAEKEASLYDDADYDIEDPLQARESRHCNERTEDVRYHNDRNEPQRRSNERSYTHDGRRRSAERSYKHHDRKRSNSVRRRYNDDKRSCSRHTSRDIDHGRRSSYKRDRYSSEDGRKRRERSQSSRSSKRSKHTRTPDSQPYTRRSSRKSVSFHSISSESTINYSKLSPHKSSESRRRSCDKLRSNDGDHRRKSSKKSRDTPKHKSDKQKSKVRSSSRREKGGRTSKK